MSTVTINASRRRKSVSILQHYVATADSKNRISLRGSQTKYFHVKALSNGSYVLEPRVLISPDAIPARTLKMIDSSVTQLKREKVSAPIDLIRFAEVEK